MKLVSFANAAFAATAASSLITTIGGRWFIVSVPFVVGTNADEEIAGSSSSLRRSYHTSSSTNKHHENNQNEASAAKRKLTFDRPHHPQGGNGFVAGGGFNEEEVGPMEYFEDEAQGRPMEYYHEGYEPQEYVPREEGRPMEYYEENYNHKTQEYTPPEEHGPMELYEDNGGPQNYIPPPRENVGRPMEYYGEGYYNYETRDYGAPARGEEGPLNSVASNHYYNNNNGYPQQQHEPHQQKEKMSEVRGGIVGRAPPADGVRPDSLVEAQNGGRGPQMVELASQPNDVFVFIHAKRYSLLYTYHFVQVFRGSEKVIDLDFLGDNDYSEMLYFAKVDFKNDCVRFYTEDDGGHGFVDARIDFAVDAPTNIVFSVNNGKVYCYPGMGCGDGDYTNNSDVDLDQRNAEKVIEYDYSPQKIRWSVNSACLLD